MELGLNLDNETLKNNFFNLKDKHDVAELLGVSYKTLVYLLYRMDISKRYKSFSIKKKSGGERIINAPISTLKIIQRKLADILYIIYIPRNCVFGFCKNKDVKQNANSHVNKNLVFNIDLENFFPSIHIGRVIGLFISKPFNLPREVAVLLAQICCHEGKLPQGAPTSPIISNMICFSLDGQLQALAREYHCTYTRYADDISFSSTSKSFPNNIVQFNNKTGEVKCGESLERIIEKNVFSINNLKTRLQKNGECKKVTGLVVNEKTNVERRYVKNIRAILYSWSKTSLLEAERKYYIINNKETSPYKNKPKFNDIILGKIRYIGMIKGQKSPIYKRLLNQYNKNMNNGHPEYPLDSISEIEKSLWIIESWNKETNIKVKQGTGFMLKNYGLVTASHVILDGGIEVYKQSDTSKKYTAQLVKRNPIRDIAIIKIDSLTSPMLFELNKADSGNLKIGTNITIAGFPDFRVGNSIHINDSRITSMSTRHATNYLVIKDTIVSGMSGGPMLDINNKVVGVITDGVSDFLTPKDSAYFAGVPINYIDEIENWE